ncbi:DUF262 domain-containing protein [Pseudomonas syringae]|uniref:DUF262 domain-containing protein n=1 Tax=Pseudomonas syringae TaxID=317 RepID=UPI000A401E09|nr:DUF262 domain-containing protein [Pseudomonas syringae]MCK9730202.1 DUF262 domain-containing protein [Pseudomonas syringae pv. syringae]
MSNEWDVEPTEDFEEDVETKVYQITSYPADLTLKGYLDKVDADQILVPDFQRKYVWDQKRASKLIESFLLGLPVPGVFLYKIRSSNKLSIIDGQQRILSSVRFFQNRFEEKIFRLSGVMPRWEGRTYDELDEPDRLLLNDTVLRATIVQQLDPADDSSIYHIFERLNTGGMNLNPMEIRRSVYQGAFANLLEELNENEHWRNIIARPKIDKRLRDVELVLRVLALQTGWKVYEKPMKTFLNTFMADINKKSEADLKQFLADVKIDFEWAVRIIDEQLWEKPFHLRGPMNYAVLDSVFSVVANSNEELEDFSSRFESLLSSPAYLSATSVSTSDERVVKIRFEEAEKYLGGD